MSIEILKKEVIPKYLSIGDDKYYEMLIITSLDKLCQIDKGEYKGPSPEIELLKIYDQLIILHTREGEDAVLDVAKVFRRAAHKVYRIMLRKKLTNKNNKFLNLVQKCL